MNHGQDHGRSRVSSRSMSAPGCPPLFIALALLLASCAIEDQQRPLNPTEQLWREAYCNGDMSYPPDAARITRWAKANNIECNSKHPRTE